ncbi:claudin domain-containing protein 2-like [Sceloporus undulatus]|uniref:claudin domain-containing protein 2-like n=1 Tax=Sceloporus undulatus TaxID=8520 RepID=UPI001C4D4E4B|nr:claudin domain-containing protein 2-like [Sceloporus undulatus]
MGWSENLASGFTIFTIFLLVITIMDHHWIYVQSERQSYYSGIWKVCKKLVCADIIAVSPNVQGAKTLLVMALFSGFVGVSFMTFTYRYSSSFTIYRYLISGMGSFITAALVFLAMSVYTIRISTHGIVRTGKVTYQWAFYIAWASCPLFILSGFCGLMAHQQVLMQATALSDKESTTTTSSTSWTTASSSFVEEEDGKKKQGEEDQEEQTGSEDASIDSRKPSSPTLSVVV